MGRWESLPVLLILLVLVKVAFSSTALPSLPPASDTVVPFHSTALPSLPPAIETAVPFQSTALPSLPPAIDTAVPFGSTALPSLPSAIDAAVPFQSTALPSLPPAIDTAVPFGSTALPSLPPRAIDTAVPFGSTALPSLITTSVEESASEILVVSVGRNNSSSMTGSTPEFTYIIVGLVAPLFVISCGVILVVTIGMFVFRNRKNREKPRHKTGYAAIGVVAASASNGFSGDYNYISDCTQPVVTHANQAYSMHFLNEGDSAGYSSSEDAYNMDKNPTYGLAGTTHTQLKTTTTDYIVTTANHVNDASCIASSETSDDLYEILV